MPPHLALHALDLALRERSGKGRWTQRTQQVHRRNHQQAMLATAKGISSRFQELKRIKLFASLVRVLRIMSFVQVKLILLVVWMLRSYEQEQTIRSRQQHPACH